MKRKQYVATVDDRKEQMLKKKKSKICATESHSCRKFVSVSSHGILINEDSQTNIGKN